MWLAPPGESSYSYRIMQHTAPGMILSPHLPIHDPAPGENWRVRCGSSPSSHRRVPHPQLLQLLLNWPLPSVNHFKLRLPLPHPLSFSTRTRSTHLLVQPTPSKNSTNQCRKSHMATVCLTQMPLHKPQQLSQPRELHQNPTAPQHVAATP